MNKQARYSLGTSAIWMMAICAVAAATYCILNAGQDFSKNKVFLLFTVAIFCDTLRYNILQQQRALSDNVCSTIISAGCLWAGIAISYLLGFYSGLGTIGLGSGYLVGALSGFSLLLLRWRKFSEAKEIERKAGLEVAPSCCPRSCMKLFRKESSASHLSLEAARLGELLSPGY